MEVTAGDWNPWKDSYRSFPRPGWGGGIVRVVRIYSPMFLAGSETFKRAVQAGVSVAIVFDPTITLERGPIFVKAHLRRQYLAVVFPNIDWAQEIHYVSERQEGIP